MRRSIAQPAEHHLLGCGIDPIARNSTITDQENSSVASLPGTIPVDHLGNALPQRWVQKQRALA
jgi:hypothetical protein